MYQPKFKDAAACSHDVNVKRKSDFLNDLQGVLFAADTATDRYQIVEGSDEGHKRHYTVYIWDKKGPQDAIDNEEESIPNAVILINVVQPDDTPKTHLVVQLYKPELTSEQHLYFVDAKKIMDNAAYVNDVRCVNKAQGIYTFRPTLTFVEIKDQFSQFMSAVVRDIRLERPSFRDMDKINPQPRIPFDKSVH